MSAVSGKGRFLCQKIHIYCKSRSIHTPDYKEDTQKYARCVLFWRGDCVRTISLGAGLERRALRVAEPKAQQWSCQRNLAKPVTRSARPFDKKKNAFWSVIPFLLKKMVFHFIVFLRSFVIFIMRRAILSRD